MNESLALLIVVQAIVAIQPTVFESALFKFTLWLVATVASGFGALLVYIARRAIPLIDKANAFFITWYGDPNDKDATGIKHTIEVMGDDLTEIKDWSKGYDRALSALAEENTALRDEWRPGDPERRSKPRTPKID